MFGIGMTELIVIFAIALIVLGPKRLPEIARSLGRGIAEFRRASMDLRREFMDASDEAHIAPPQITDAASASKPAAAAPSAAPAPPAEAPRDATRDG